MMATQKNAKDPAQIHTLFVEAFNAGDIDSLLALYEPRAVLMVNGKPVTGHPAIRAAYQGFLVERPRMTLKTRSTMIFDDSLAVLHGDWSIDSPSTGKNDTARRGLSTEVVRRQADGSWRFVIDNPHTAQ